MIEPAIKANERESLRLYERGVAAARGGQRRVAAGLLSRAVQLNPRHEASWLWLSGMLDSPDEIAFCLRSVLAINPENTRARQGLDWLEKHGKANGHASSPSAITSSLPAAVTAAPPLPAPSVARGTTELPIGAPSWRKRVGEGLRNVRTADPHAVIEQELQARTHGESWWVNFRSSRRDMGRVRLVLWMVPILLLAMTLALNIALNAAVKRNEALARARATAVAVPPVEVEPPTHRAAELVLAELPPSDDARTLAYLSQIVPTRDSLRAAVAEYRATTNRPGGSSTTHAAAARRLRDTIEKAYGRFEATQPPSTLGQAHAYYLSALETELAALDDMLAFYSSFSVENANRAAVRMAEAGRYIERAQTSYDQRLRAIGPSSIPVQTMR